MASIDAMTNGAFWNSQQIRNSLDDLVDSPDLPLEEEQVQDAALELRLGPEVYVSGSDEKTELRPGDMIAIKPGEIALLLTEEFIKMPVHAMALISLKTSVKVPGLINVSGFHVDPGFEGRLVFTVYNAGTETCAFLRGQRMFLIWFANLNGEEAGKHKGHRQHQNVIKAADITHLTDAGAAPVRLQERIRRLEITLSVYGALLLAFLLAVVGLLFR